MILDIDTWHERNRLGQYAELFRSHEIDGSLVRWLSGEDLKEMGVRRSDTARSCSRQSPHWLRHLTLLRPSSHRRALTRAQPPSAGS
jgi:hypothetical protein